MIRLTVVAALVTTMLACGVPPPKPMPVDYATCVERCGTVSDAVWVHEGDTTACLCSRSSIEAFYSKRIVPCNR